MYARQTSNTKVPRNMNLPPNYGGSAFYEPPVGNMRDSEQDELTPEPPEATQSEELHANADHERESRSVGLFHGFGSTSGGIGLEELLILGLALLISQNDVKDDLALLLLLLVFIK